MFGKMFTPEIKFLFSEVEDEVVEDEEGQVEERSHGLQNPRGCTCIPPPFGRCSCDGV